MKVTKTVLVLYITFSNFINNAFSIEPQIHKPACDPGITIVWQKEIWQKDRRIQPYTIKIDESKNIVRFVGLSCLTKPKPAPRRINAPEIFEYRLDLNNDKSDLKTIMAMDGNDIALSNAVLASQLIDSNIVMIRSVYKSSDFQQLAVSSDWQVKTEKIPGLTRNSVSTLGACINLNGDVALCGNSGYIRKVLNGGKIAWDANYKSAKADDTALGVAFARSTDSLFAFGCSFEPESKFTTKDSCLWLASLDPNGNFKAKMEFQGISNFGKSSAFCLSKSDCPLVIYDNEPAIGKCKINVSKFSSDLKIKHWKTQIFDASDMMVSQMFLEPLKDNHILAIFSTFGTRTDGSNYFYILDDNGNIINKAVFNENLSYSFIFTVFNDMIFVVTNSIYPEGSDRGIVKLICFKINPSH